MVQYNCAVLRTVLSFMGIGVAIAVLAICVPRVTDFFEGHFLLTCGVFPALNFLELLDHATLSAFRFFEMVAIAANALLFAVYGVTVHFARRTVGGRLSR